MNDRLTKIGLSQSNYLFALPRLTQAQAHSGIDETCIPDHRLTGIRCIFVNKVWIPGLKNLIELALKINVNHSRQIINRSRGGRRGKLWSRS